MPLKPSQIRSTFGDFKWHDDPARKGAITIPGDWILHNLARIAPPLPIPAPSGRLIREITCHHLIADQLTSALAYIRDHHLGDHIHTWDGCWVPRHMNWNPSKPLSSHSWGIAFDINAAQFPFGLRRQQEPSLVNALAKFGFEWGGNWRVPDSMHFEAIVILSVAKSVSRRTAAQPNLPKGASPK